MEPIIRFRVRKELDPTTERSIRKLKGGLIAQAFTDIIYFDTEEPDYYVHYFTTTPNDRDRACEYITSYSISNSLEEVVYLL
ncbi:hypothetical protein [Flavobacterium beibuense]|uniref:hypothetical protein n=1 Tax=Flavobacterium beibuense TaxID=657326 RepID=UPI003A959028